MKHYLNKKTGEIIVADNKKFAVRYFKADGKVVGYKVHAWNVVEYKPRADGK